MFDGIININKEKGYTSHDVVARLRGILGQKKIGHTGTLDPDAVGVLPVCLGKATKLCDLLTDKEKTYQTVLLLGTETDTQDISGQVLRECAVTADPAKICACIQSFQGEIMQSTGEAALRAGAGRHPGGEETPARSDPPYHGHRYGEPTRLYGGDLF